MTALETNLLDQNLFAFLLSEVNHKGRKWLNSLWFIDTRNKLDKTPFLSFTFFLDGYIQAQVSNVPPTEEVTNGKNPSMTPVMHAQLCRYSKISSEEAHTIEHKQTKI